MPDLLVLSVAASIADFMMKITRTTTAKNMSTSLITFVLKSGHFEHLYSVVF